MILTEQELDRSTGNEENRAECRALPPSYDDTLRAGRAGPSTAPPSPHSRDGSFTRPGGSRTPPSLPPRPEEMNLPSHSAVASQEPIIYTFVQKSFNAMVLAYHPASLPLYHVSHHLNGFIPTSYITVVRRGDSEDGTFVGQFEMGISVKKSTVLLEGKERIIDVVLVKAKDNIKSEKIIIWKWHSDPSKHIHWTYKGPVKYCYLHTRGPGSNPMLATFTAPPLTPRADGRPSPPTNLKRGSD